MVPVLVRTAGLAGALSLLLSAAQTPPASRTSALLLNITTAVGRGGPTDGAQLRLSATVESPDTPRFKSLSATLVGAAGNIAASWTAPAASLVDGPIAFTLTALPGHYTLRIMSADRSARAGSAELAVDLALASAGVLRLGSLNLGLAPPNAAPVPIPGRGARGELVTPAPAPRAVFANEANAVAFFDLYGGVANEHVSIALEIRRRVDGPPVQLLQATIRPARAGEPDHYLVVAPINLAQLSPGDYEVRATVSVAGQAPGVITRTLRKVATSAAIH